MTGFTLYLKRLFYKLLVVFFWLAVWQAFYFLVQNEILIPAPRAVFARLGQLIFIQSFWAGILFTIYRVLMGVLLATVLGVILGIVSGLNRFFYELISPLVVAIKSTPIMSFIIVALVWFGSSNLPIFICFLIAFPIIWTNIWEGINNVDVKLLEMAKTYQVTGFNILRGIYLPQIKPYFISGFLTIIGLGWKATVTAEVISHPVRAIGSSLYNARIYINSVDLFAWTLAIIGISLLLEKILVHLLKTPRRRKINSAG
ncbi:MAG: ABC transporter permease [Dethiobacteria bacterium]|jgi:NitT/TauT family transport system permease protein